MPLSSPHVQGPASVTQVMLRVIYALLPAIALEGWLFGWGVPVNLLIALACAGAGEAAVLVLRDRPLWPCLSDASAAVTAVLLAMALPPLAPWWLVASGTLFAIIIAKQLYGGLGYNPFNPAMAGYVFLLVSFPLEMSSWLPPAGLREHSLSLAETLRYIFTGALPAGLSFDAMTGATALDTLRIGVGQHRSVDQLLAGAPFGLMGGRGAEWVNGLILLGGLWLLQKRIITWHVPVGLLGAMAALSLAFHLYSPDRFAGPLFHLMSGGAMLGAFFIATDPVSGATSDRGRLWFGIGVGAIAWLIRSFGGYPDGIAFGVLLMNLTAPALDYYTLPRTYGHDRR